MSYRLLALDMDGTLLTSSKVISRATLEALRVCEERGVAVALCTGRGAAELVDYRDDLRGIARYGSLVSGGLVYDFGAEAPIAVEAMDTDVALSIIEQGIREDAMIHILAVKESVVRPEDIRRMDKVGMGIYVPMFKKCCTFVEDLASYVRSHEGTIVKVNLYHHDTSARERSREALGKLPLTLVDAEETSLESTAQGITKARGLKRLCGHLGIGLDECVMVGDAPNDLEVLRVVGCPVAMGKATPEVKAVAHDVVASNDEDGIVEVVHRIVFA